MEVKASKRAFRYNNIPLADPDPNMNVQQVRDFYANIYPEITTAEIDGPENKGANIVYTFRRAVGTKGGGVDHGYFIRLTAAVVVSVVLISAGITWLVMKSFA